eukprot:CAMPEP_0179449718 /NCGR_PEP_ID=MMETSP0799-20121207/33596_1 /TAXON_ID=46947 /ORGANISM="Geminigera cryophila, Strain CCMP2564" /LENGTH=165 /DNA_ID=CAMNT_0021242905 /DNA_START=198 /DNA_END=692 /DNA_ORIENTATION=-
MTFTSLSKDTRTLKLARAREQAREWLCVRERAKEGHGASVVQVVQGLRERQRDRERQRETERDREMGLQEMPRLLDDQSPTFLQKSPLCPQKCSTSPAKNPDTPRLLHSSSPATYRGNSTRDILREQYSDVREHHSDVMSWETQRERERKRGWGRRCSGGGGEGR